MEKERTINGNIKLNYYSKKVLYVQEVVTLQKKTFNIFASENEVYTIY